MCCGAALWYVELSCLSGGLRSASLSYTLKGGVLHPSGSLDKCLGTLLVSGEFPQEPASGWFRSIDISLLVVVSEQISEACLLASWHDLGIFLLESKCHG